LLALAVAALAGGCASPAWQSITPGTSETEVQARLGAPSERYQLADGSRRWLYRAPGEAKWAADFDPAGHIVSMRQVLTAAEFGIARPGEWTTHDVLVHFGKPAETAYFSRMQRLVWSYRFADGSASYSTIHFYFDPQGVLRQTQLMPDYLLES